MLCILLMSNKILYVVQPYKVGTKNTKSLAMIIPAGFARDNHIDTSTIFILRNLKDQTGNLTFQRVDCENEKMTPARESFEASSQQASSSGAQ
jgi:hypothetical protein